MVSELFSGFFILVIQSVTFTYFRLGHFSSPPHTSLRPLLPPSSPCTWPIKHIITYPPPPYHSFKISPLPYFFFGGGGGHPLWDWAKLNVFLQLSDCNLRPGIPLGCSGCGERESYLHIYFSSIIFSTLYTYKQLFCRVC